MPHDFDMVIIGGGAAGLTAAGISASLGAKTALVEANRLGGDCTWYGCVPSKTLLKAAKVAHTIKTADRYGLKASQPCIDFASVMRHVHSTQKHVFNEADAPPIYEKMGIKVITARARFLTPHSAELTHNDGNISVISSRYFVIATGSSPIVPPIEGLSEVDFLTNETIFSLSKLPKKLVVVGGGPIGIEMAQAFRRLGSDVEVIDMADRILPKDDLELSGLLRHSLMEEGIRFTLSAAVRKFQSHNGSARVIAQSAVDGKELLIEGDALLISIGRRANTQALNLKTIGISLNKSGIVIDKHCRTSVKNIFACGDVAGSFQFTHMAEHMAKVAITNALLHIPLSIDTDHVPWVTYTEPELAHVGASEDELKKKSIAYNVYRFPFSKIDRAVTDAETVGMIKVFAKGTTGKIYGVNILGANAGEMIGEYAVALRHGITLRRIADTIHPYPTYVLGNRRAADQWYVRKQSRTFVRWLRRIFGYRGQLPDTSDPNRIV
ncbi:MAG: NAD(P)/FAD-dependent oxidoreductase [Ignavibacteriae bacterium]|nr:NAD(P)/FAD-dependent oxidoreductase [Ignavibacteriota bacterium]